MSGSLPRAIPRLSGGGARFGPLQALRHDPLGLFRRVRVQVQDLTGNILDRQHFPSVHDMAPPDADHFAVRFDGPVAQYRRWYRQFYADWEDAPEGDPR